MRRRYPPELRRRLAALKRSRFGERAQAPLHWLDRHEREREAIEDARREGTEAEGEQHRG